MGPFISGKSSEMLRGLESFIVLLCSLYLWAKTYSVSFIETDISDIALVSSIVHLQYWCWVKNRVCTVLWMWTAASICCTHDGNPRLLMFFGLPFTWDPFTVQKIVPVFNVEQKMSLFNILKAIQDYIMSNMSVPLNRYAVDRWGTQ